MAFPNDRTYTFDVNNQLSDNAAAYTASGYLQAGGADGVVDLGGNQGTSPVQLARIDAMAIFDVTAIDITSGNERYTLKILVSNDPAFLTGVFEAAAIGMGKGSAGTPATQGDSVIGRYEVGFTNQVAGSIYQYAKAYLVVAGTTPSISIFSFIAVLPEP
jgi:hypothetical protein